MSALSDLQAQQRSQGFSAERNATYLQQDAASYQADSGDVDNGSVDQTAGDGGDVPGAFSAGIQLASWRGLPFVASTEGVKAGRSVALHEYPYREQQPAWPEDTGRLPRRFQIAGYLTGNDVLQQRRAMIKAAEVAGPGALVHPTLGAMQVVLLEFSISMRADALRMSEMTFDFIEWGPQDYPSAEDDTGAGVDDAADYSDQAADDDCESGLAGAFHDVAGAVQSGLGAVGGVIQQGVGAVSGFIDATGIPQVIHEAAGIGSAALSVAGDASGILNSVRGVAGAFGRYSGGALLGGGNPLGTVSRGAQHGGEHGRRAERLGEDAVSGTTAPSGSAGQTLAAAVKAVVDAVQAVCVDPRDQLRVWLVMAAVAGDGPVARRGRRAAVIALARAARAYQPSSYDDALTVLQQVTDALDAEITAAGDAFEDRSFNALQALQVAVVRDMLARGASLAPLRTVTLSGNLPALVVAHLLYGDATRADEVVRRVDPVHPGFMPRSMTVLAR